MATVTATIRVADLDDGGRALLDTLRRQSDHLAAILTERRGVVHADLWDNDTLGSDDTISVRVRSRLPWSERARRYGVAGLMGADIRSRSGKSYREDSYGTTRIPRDDAMMGPQGDPIPTEDYIARVVAGYGDERGRRRWEVPMDILRAVRTGAITGAEAINRAAAALAQWCEDGQYEVE